ncbi:MAG: TonB-dependent receptor family protein [Saprospiraceae bacterium]|nr:TonB-dependent receptor family protein [Saprospiraceae bacterium]
MKQLITFTLSLCFVCLFGNAQAQKMPAIGQLKGIVIDATNQEPIEFTTISLINAKDSSLVTGGMTDENGSFEIKDIPFGKYITQIDFIGYTSIEKEVVIKPDAYVVDLEKIQLGVASELLNEAKVTAERQMMQLGIDRKIFDVEKSQLAKGGTALDVMRNTPTLDVDMDGNVSLRGSQGVQVMINGKPSALTGASRKAVLRQIPASAIKQVEIITNPSAKYDPDGTSGIINIVLKKNKLQGINGNLSGSIGTLANKYNLSAGLNYRNDKVNIYSSYNFNRGLRWNSNNSYQINRLSTGDLILDRNTTGENTNMGHFAKLGMDWYINPKNTLSFSGSISPNQNRGNSEIDYIFREGNTSSFTNRTLRNTLDNSNGMAFEGNVNYTSNFKGEGHQLEFDGTYSQYMNDAIGDYDESILDEAGNNTGANPFLQQNTSNNLSRISNIKLDYTLPLPKIKGKFEAGWKTTLRQVDNEFISNFQNADGAWTLDTMISNHFKYNEQVHALYATYGQKFKKISFQVGLRLEQALTGSELLNTNETFQNNYFSFFPSAHLNYQLAQTQQLQLSYSRRINRPDIWSLNPFSDLSDPLNIETGNPYLKPEYINSVELSHSLYWKKGSLSTSAYFRYTTDIIRRMKELQDNGVSRLYYTNFDRSVSYGLEMATGIQAFKWWRIQGSLNLFYVEEDASNLNTDFVRGSFGGNVSFGSTFNLPADFQIQMNAFYRIPLRVVIGNISGFVWSSVGVSKSFLKDKSLTLSLRLEDPFNLQKFAFNLDDGTFQQDGTYNWESRIAWLTLSYDFGKMDMKTRRKMSSRGNNGGGGRGNSGGGL